MQRVLPLCLSMIVCEQVAFDPSGRPSILGVVHELRCDRFPALSSRLVVWVELTNGRGQLPIDFVALASGGAAAGDPVAEVRVVVSFANPLEVRFAGAQLDPLRLASPGELVFRMSLGDAVIMERRVRVVQRSGP